MIRSAFSVLFVLPLLCPVTHAQMKGDAAAVAAARRIIEHMGGSERWSRARWIYAQERAYFAAQAEPAQMEFWRRTDAPAEWSRRRSPAGNRQYAWTANGGWRIRNGEISALTRETMQGVLGWWPGEIYVMYARFARNDAALRLVTRQETAGQRSFVVLDDATGANLGEFHVNVAGELVAWKRSFGVDSVHYVYYVYGPLKAVGDLRVPEWGALHDGSFRFHYTDFRLSETHPPVSFERPAEVPAELR